MPAEVECIYNHLGIPANNTIKVVKKRNINLKNERVAALKGKKSGYLRNLFS